MHNLNKGKIMLWCNNLILFKKRVYKEYKIKGRLTHLKNNPLEVFHVWELHFFFLKYPFRQLIEKKKKTILNLRS